MHVAATVSVPFGWGAAIAIHILKVISCRNMQGIGYSSIVTAMLLRKTWITPAFGRAFTN